MSGTALPDSAAEEEFVASLFKGGELLSANKVVEAREHLENAIRLAPKNEKAQNLLGLAYFKLGLFDQASEVYEALVRENPADPTLRVNLGLVYLKTNNLERCVHEFEAATDLEPTHKKAHNYLGLALAQVGDYARAREHFIAAGSDAMADKMSKALVTRAETQPPAEALTVPPPPPASAPAISPTQPQSPEFDTSADEEAIEVMSDEQEPVTGESPVALEPEEVAVEVEAHDPSAAFASRAPAAATVPLTAVMRPSQPNLGVADWGEQLEQPTGSHPPPYGLVEPSLDDDNPLIEASDFGEEPAAVRTTEPFDDGARTFGRSDAPAAPAPTASSSSGVHRPTVTVSSPSGQRRAPVAHAVDGPSDFDERANIAGPASTTSAPPATAAESTPKASHPTRAQQDFEAYARGEPPPVSPEAYAQSEGPSAEEAEPSDPALPVDEYGEPLTMQQFGALPNAVYDPPRELVSVELMTPEPAPPVENSWADPDTGEQMAEAAQQYVSEEGEYEQPPFDPNAVQSDAQDNDWSAASAEAVAPPQGQAPDDALPSWVTEPAAAAQAPSQNLVQSNSVEISGAAADSPEMDWSSVADTAGEPPSVALADDARPPPREDDWVSNPPDPLAPAETSTPDPEWVSQPLSEVNFTEAGAGAAGPTDPAHVEVPDHRETVPTYEPRTVTGPPHVDLSFSGAENTSAAVVTEPHGVAAHDGTAVPHGYSAISSQRLVDLGASTQWVADTDRGPFHFGSDGMAVSVNGEMLVRLPNLVAVVGSVDVAPEMRRVRGRATEQPFGVGEQQLQRVRGNGVMYLEPGRSLFHAIDLDDEGAYLREERVFAFEEPIAFENGRLTDAGKSLDLVNLKGQGRVLLQLEGALKAMPLPLGSPMVVPITRLIGWFGRVTPRMIGFGGQGAVELTGEGYALLGAASERS